MKQPMGPVGCATPRSYSDAVAAPTYKRREAAKAVAWKQATAALPDAARVPAPYVGKDGIASGQPLASGVHHRVRGSGPGWAPKVRNSGAHDWGVSVSAIAVRVPPC